VNNTDTDFKRLKDEMAKSSHHGSGFLNIPEDDTKSVGAVSNLD
jgi:hypothetical protein